MFEELEKTRLASLECFRCSLSETRLNVVFSDGIPNSKLMLIGEAPGMSEDEQGKPFVGRAGMLLDKILESVGFSRQTNIYICNSLKCRPPNNRDPNESEKEACRPFLDAQIDILKPRLIMLCGRVAMNSFIPNAEGITKMRGRWFDGPHGSKMMPVFHPSYLLRNAQRTKGSPKWFMWQDMQEIRREYDKLGG
ncbi:MAG: uracil-DNA glycosylase [Leptospirales bacterium]|nr:uracil-DNA glycosylase [Leptospirales bacterium]